MVELGVEVEEVRGWGFSGREAIDAQQFKGPHKASYLPRHKENMHKAATHIRNYALDNNLRKKQKTYICIM